MAPLLHRAAITTQNKTIRASARRISHHTAPSLEACYAGGPSVLGPQSLERSWQAEDICSLVYGAMSYRFSAIRDLLAIFARLRPKKRPPRLLVEPPLGQSLPKWDRL